MDPWPVMNANIPGWMKVLIHFMSFSDILLEADALGLTEPDAREDLSGKDVARKLLILGREVGLTKEFDDVKVQSLVPKALNGTTTLPQFRESVKTMAHSYKL